MINNAPIVLFVYNRPWHTRQTLEALTRNDLADKSELFIYSDGPKSNARQEDISKIDEVRKIINERKWCKEIHIIKSDTNKRLADSIINGVTEVVNLYGKIIVLEDDLITSNYFLDYMNKALELYETNEKVASINGFFVPVTGKLPETFFLKFADCWGWATWERGWIDFEGNAAKLLKEIKERNLSYQFDLKGAYNFTQMLSDQAEGKIDSWAIRWYASTFLKNKLSLCPKHSLVKHIGNDGSGTNVGKTDFLYFELNEDPVIVEKIPIVESRHALVELTRYFKPTQNRGKFPFLKSVLPPILLNIYRKLKQRNISVKSMEMEVSQYGWSGNYDNWEDAKKNCSGYESDNILNKVKNSLLKVKNGEAVYERDSVLFDEIQYSWGLLAGLQRAAIEYNGKLCVLDFGGSLGSSYFQNRSFLGSLKELTWCIVEQPHFVDCGKVNFENDQLCFFYTIEECMAKHKPNVLLLSGVLQYLANPYGWIECFINLNIPYIIIDRTAFIENGNNILTVQKVPPSIYEASYPAWLFNKIMFLNYFEKKYNFLCEFDSHLGYEININGVIAKYKGFILNNKNGNS